jgi:hypothetical protein
VQAVRNVLKFGEWATGSQEWLTPQRFLFRAVGDVFLLRTGSTAHEHVPLEEETLEAALKLPLGDLVAKPALLLQTILDHNCASYVHDIMVAASVQHRRELRARQLPAAPPADGNGAAALPAEATNEAAVR